MDVSSSPIRFLVTISASYIWTQFLHPEYTCMTTSAVGSRVGRYIAGGRRSVISGGIFGFGFVGKVGFNGQSRLRTSVCLTHSWSF